MLKLNRFYIYAIALLAMLFWGFSYIWIKIVYQYYQPLTVVFLRLFFSSLILLFVYHFFRKQKIDRKDLKYFIILAFFEPFCYFLGESFGLKYVSSTVAAVIIATIPVFTPIGAFIFLKEKINFINIIGLLVSFSGVLMLIFKNDFTFEASPKGVMLMFVAVFSAIGFVIFVKRLTEKYSIVTIITFQNIFGTLFMLPLFLYFDFMDFITVEPNYELVSTLVKLVIFSSILAFLFFIAVIRELGPTRANIFSNFIPVVTAIFSFYILDEEFNTGKIVGIALVLAGVLLSQIINLNAKRNNKNKLIV